MGTIPLSVNPQGAGGCAQEVAGASPGGGQAPGQEWAVGLALPGVTVPWGHSLVLWLATAVSLAAHEVGLCASLVPTCQLPYAPERSARRSA